MTEFLDLFGNPPDPDPVPGRCQAEVKPSSSEDGRVRQCARHVRPGETHCWQHGGPKLPDLETALAEAAAALRVAVVVIEDLKRHLDVCPSCHVARGHAPSCPVLEVEVAAERAAAVSLRPRPS